MLHLSANPYKWVNAFTAIPPPQPSPTSKPPSQSPTSIPDSSSSAIKTLVIALSCAIGGIVVGTLIFMCYKRTKRQTVRNSNSEFQDLAYRPNPEYQDIAYRPNSDATLQ